MIEVGNIVTLENKKEYLLLEDLNYSNRRFVYAVGVNPDETPTSEYVIFEAINIEDGEYLKVVNNKDEYDALVEEFKNVIGNKMISGEYDDMIKDFEGGE